MLLKPVADSTPSYAGPCSHEHAPGGHVPFANFQARCRCGALYLIRGCGDAKRRERVLPPDPLTGGTMGHVQVECTCGAVADGVVPGEAIPSTLIASRLSPS
jgi:hypothetical protein